MSVSSLYHIYRSLETELARVAPAVRPSSRTRLALTVTGIIGAKSCVVAEVARTLVDHRLSAASDESTTRRLRRTMNDGRLTDRSCYAAMIAATLTQALGADRSVPILICIDESSHTAHVHLLRAAVAYRGSAIPLAWETWEQNRAQPDGAYGEALDRLFAAIAARLPADRPVIVLADRAYAGAPFFDRLAKRGWHGIVRVPTTGTHRWREQVGPTAGEVGAEYALAERIKQMLPAPGTRWRRRGQFAKQAGWRPINLVGIWSRTEREPLVVVTTLPADWSVLATYTRRFWIEASFRADKSVGWQWEQSQVRAVPHHQVLLLALAWATLLALAAGAAVAEERLAAMRAHPRRAARMRQSLFQLGVRALRRPDDRRRRLRVALPKLFGPAWQAEWAAMLSRQRIFAQPVRP